MFVNFTVQEANIPYCAACADEVLSAGADHFCLNLQTFMSRDVGEKYSARLKRDFAQQPFSWLGAVQESRADVALLEKQVAEVLRTYSNAAIMHPLDCVDLDVFFHKPSQVFRSPPPIGCLAPSRILEVTPSGDVIPCHDFPDVVVGNVRDSTVEEVWLGHRMM